MNVKLKAPRETRFQHGVIVDLFPTGSYLCPLGLHRCGLQCGSQEMGALGYKEADIMQIGRWHSSAYLHYVKNGRLQRMRVVQQVAKWVMRK